MVYLAAPVYIDFDRLAWPWWIFPAILARCDLGPVLIISVNYPVIFAPGDKVLKIVIPFRRRLCLQGVKSAFDCFISHVFSSINRFSFWVMVPSPAASNQALASSQASASRWLAMLCPPPLLFGFVSR